ncbi:MAG: ATP-binding protein, partial [Mariprofundus sp.]
LLKSTIKERLWPESLTVSEHFEQLPAVAGDADLLQGVFENLYDNAVYAMLRQGEIRIEARLITAEQGESMAEVMVHDEGSGMTEEFIRQRLFHLFATSKSNGLGIGLYLSRRIVEAHGGTITAKSAGARKGSSFIVRLPLWQHIPENKENKL